MLFTHSFYISICKLLAFWSSAVFLDHHEMEIAII